MEFLNNGAIMFIRRVRMSWPIAAVLVLLFAAFGSTPPPARAAAGDWPTYLMDNARHGYNSSETIINPTSAPNLKLHWTHTAAGAISTQPVEANGLIYWGSWDGYEHATDLNNAKVWATNLGQTTDSSCNPPTGAFLWEHCLSSGPVLGAVTEVPGVLAVGQGTYLMVIAASTGQTLFRYQDTKSGSLFYGAASISNGVLYIGNQDGHLYAFGL